jgi:YD repeat-containing protein
VRRILTSGGIELRLEYLNVHGRLTRVERVAGRNRQTLVSYGYDLQGQLTSVSDARGEVVRRFAYQAGLMVSHTQALGFECRYGWQTIAGQPRVAEMATSEGTWARFAYDIAGRRTEVLDAAATPTGCTTRTTRSWNAPTSMAPATRSTTTRPASPPR